MTLTALQSRLLALVAARPLLDGRPVLIEDKGNLVSDLETALAETAIAVVIAPASGQAKDNAPRGRNIWTESIEIAIHRGPLTDPDAPTTVALLDDLRAALHGAMVDPANAVHGLFVCTRHDLRENGDGTYARILTIEIENLIP